LGADGAVDNEQPNSDTTRLSGLDAMEQRLFLFGRNTAPGIDHFKNHSISLLVRLHAHRSLATISRRHRDDSILAKR
jgi:hypothetical protein